MAERPPDPRRRLNLVQSPLITLRRDRAILAPASASKGPRNGLFHAAGWRFGWGETRSPLHGFAPLLAVDAEIIATTSPRRDWLLSELPFAGPGDVPFRPCRTRTKRTDRP